MGGAIMLVVELNARQSSGSPRRPDLPDKRTVSATTLVEASDVCQRFIAEHDLGSSNWNGGRVRDLSTGKIVALVSYNGRIWTPQRDWRERKEISIRS
jgi:hypothetical protein